MLEHVGVHRRRQQDRRPGREVERAQEVVGNAVGELADDVRRGRRDEQQPDARGQRDVLDVRVGAARELIGDHAAPGDRLERHFPDESAGGARQDRRDVVAALLQLTRDLDRLVGADAAGDAEGDVGHVTPSGSVGNLLDLAFANFLLGEPHQLFIAGCPRGAAPQELLGARASQHDEFKRVGNLQSCRSLQILSQERLHDSFSPRSHRPLPGPLRQHDRRQPVTHGSSSSLMTT